MFQTFLSGIRERNYCRMSHLPDKAKLSHSSRGLHFIASRCSVSLPYPSSFSASPSPILPASFPYSPCLPPHPFSPFRLPFFSLPPSLFLLSVFPYSSFTLPCSLRLSLLLSVFLSYPSPFLASPLFSVSLPYHYSLMPPISFSIAPLPFSSSISVSPSFILQYSFSYPSSFSIFLLYHFSPPPPLLLYRLLHLYLLIFLFLFIFLL